MRKVTSGREAHPFFCFINFALCGCMVEAGLTEWRGGRPRPEPNRGPHIIGCQGTDPGFWPSGNTEECDRSIEYELATLRLSE